jgi:rsbT co-antagonist protein RsbR
LERRSSGVAARDRREARTMARASERREGSGPPLLRDEMEVDDQEVRRRKEFLQFQAEDEEALRILNETAKKYADPVIEGLYEHFLAFEETRAFFRDPKVLDRVKRLQKEYFLRLTEGHWGADYVANRLRIGTVHERINLAPKWYLGAYNFYLRAVAIRELSTPVLQIRDRLLLLPIIGLIDTQRARLITDSLLRAIRINRAKVVVMDITGVATIDSRVANYLLQTVSAARLMGAVIIVTGLSSEVAQSLVALGIDLGPLNFVGDLQGGIEEAERLLGYRVTQIASSSEAAYSQDSE